ncbi:hypothetical protein BKA80DRAFT_24222 [Phyllosticta citrichinensis]
MVEAGVVSSDVSMKERVFSMLSVCLSGCLAVWLFGCLAQRPPPFSPPSLPSLKHRPSPVDRAMAMATRTRMPVFHHSPLPPPSLPLTFHCQAHPS